jgi:hypothetical protein
MVILHARSQALGGSVKIVWICSTRGEGIGFYTRLKLGMYSYSTAPNVALLGPLMVLRHEYGDTGWAR